MTDFASIAPRVPAARYMPERWRRRAPLLLLAAGGAVGWALGAVNRPVALPEPGLVLLLRFMAALKGAAALGAAALLLWRMRRPLPAPASLLYGAGLASMASAPGLIWSLGPVAAGAACFHAGLILFAVAALRDGDALPAKLRRQG